MNESIDSLPAVEAQTATTVRQYDLLRFGLLDRAVRARWFPVLLQGLLLAGFVGFIVLAWGVHPPPGVDAKLYAKSNLVTLTIWGLWWPLMIWCAVLLGRAWCAVCPLELLSNVAERLARALGFQQRVLSRWLAGGVVTVGLYATLQLLVASAQLHRTPAYTGWFLIGLLSLAALAGLLFKDRAFCRGFCPVGLLLSTYGRGGMLAVRAGSRLGCEQCTSRGCVRAANRYRVTARSCPSLLNPAKLASNRDCLLCGHCIKSCEPGSMRLWLRPLFAREDQREKMASWPVTVFVVLVSGFVLWELCTESPQAEAVFMAVPAWIAARSNATGAIVGVINWGWALLVVPAVGWTVLAGCGRLFGERRSFEDFLRTQALPMAAVIAGGHMCKALAKFNVWFPHLKGALADPRGADTARAIAAGLVSRPGALFGHGAVGLCGLLIMAGAVAFALREARISYGRGHRDWRHAAPVAIMAGLFLTVVSTWFLS